MGMNYKYKRPREARQALLMCKYGYKGMAKTNYRKHGKRNNAKVQTMRAVRESQDQEASPLM